MKKQYKFLLIVFGIEFLIVSILQENNIKIQSWIGNAIGAFVFLLPIQILLFLLSKDEKFSKRKRICFKIIFWYINICCIAGGIATLILGN